MKIKIITDTETLFEKEGNSTITEQEEKDLKALEQRDCISLSVELVEGVKMIETAELAEFFCHPDKIASITAKVK